MQTAQHVVIEFGKLLLAKNVWLTPALRNAKQLAHFLHLSSTKTIMSVINTILTWPLVAYQEATTAGGGSYLPLIAGVGVSYYWAGGLPTQGQDMMTLAQAYLLGGVAVYATGQPSAGGVAM